MPDAVATHTDPVLGESVLLGATTSGLPVRVVPTDRFGEAVAVVSFQYGSIDLGYRADGVAKTSPEGMAHYLEHKLFEDEDLQAFDRFARRGARVNAMTGFATTTYFFQATSQFEDNLQDLLHLVSRAHITRENVDKERGIIAQEIQMYEDSPEYRGFFDLLGCLYPTHPVRHPVGGTVASIQQITAEDLIDCHRVFYRTGNASLAVAGPVDVARVMALAQACDLPGGAVAERIAPADHSPLSPERRSHRRKMQVGRTKVLIGFKEAVALADAEARLRRELVTEILLDRLFGPSSEVREVHRVAGEWDDTLSSMYLSEHSFGVAVISAECDDPDRLVASLQRVLFGDVAMDAEHLERVRRKFLGRYVRSFDSQKSLAFGHAKEALLGMPPFRSLERMLSIRLDEVASRKDELFQPDRCAVAVVASA